MRKAIFAVAVVLLLGIGSVAVARVDHGWGRPGDAADRVGILEEVLGDLVTDGVITQEQADAITTAVEGKKEEMAEQRQQLKEQLKSFWEDDVLTTEEIEQLPFAQRILESEKLSEALEDGRITKEEMKELRSEKSAFGKRGGRHGGGRH